MEYIVFESGEFMRFITEVARNDSTKLDYLKNILGLSELANKFTTTDIPAYD